jgi:hypothetical protein
MAGVKAGKWNRYSANTNVQKFKDTGTSVLSAGTQGATAKLHTFLTSVHSGRADPFHGLVTFSAWKSQLSGAHSRPGID